MRKGGKKERKRLGGEEKEESSRKSRGKSGKERCYERERVEGYREKRRKDVRVEKGRSL